MDCSCLPLPTWKMAHAGQLQEKFKMLSNMSEYCSDKWNSTIVAKCIVVESYNYSVSTNEQINVLYGWLTVVVRNHRTGLRPQSVYLSKKRGQDTCCRKLWLHYKSPVADMMIGVNEASLMLNFTNSLTICSIYDILKGWRKGGRNIRSGKWINISEKSAGCTLICKTLQKISTIHKLSLNEINIDKEAVDNLAIVLSQNKQIEELDFSNNNLQNAGYIVIFNALRQVTTLTTILFSSNNLLILLLKKQHMNSHLFCLAIICYKL